MKIKKQKKLKIHTRPPTQVCKLKKIKNSY